jgi:hypothetical protein
MQGLFKNSDASRRTYECNKNEKHFLVFLKVGKGRGENEERRWESGGGKERGGREIKRGRNKEASVTCVVNHEL